MSETSSVESDRLSPEAKRMKEARAVPNNIVGGGIAIGRGGK